MSGSKKKGKRKRTFVALLVIEVVVSFTPLQKKHIEGIEGIELRAQKNYKKKNTLHILKGLYYKAFT